MAPKKTKRAACPDAKDAPTPAPTNHGSSAFAAAPAPPELPVPPEAETNVLRLMLIDRDRARRASERRAGGARSNRRWRQLVKELSDDERQSKLKGVLQVLRALSGEPMTMEDTKSKSALCAYASRAMRAYASRSLETTASMQHAPRTWSEVNMSRDASEAKRAIRHKRLRTLNEMTALVKRMRESCDALLEEEEEEEKESR